MEKFKKPVTGVVVGAGWRGMVYSSFSKLHPDRWKVVGVAEPRDWPVNEVAQAAWFYCTIDKQPHLALPRAEAAYARAPGDTFVRRVLGWAQALNLMNDEARRTLEPIAAQDGFAAYLLAPERPEKERGLEALAGDGDGPVVVEGPQTEAAAAARAVLTWRVAEAQRDATGRAVVGLTGGVFQNRLLCELAAAQLSERDFRVLLPTVIPANDGGLSYGQVADFLGRHH